jgi:alpha-glucosidase
MTIHSSVSHPPLFRVANTAPGRIDLSSSTGAAAHLFILEQDLIRVLVLPDGRLHQPASWAIAPGMEDVPAEGRDRFDISGFTCPQFRLVKQPERLRIETSRLALTLDLRGLLCHWDLGVEGQWHRVARDRPTQSYNFGWWDDRIYHYLARERDEMYFGLGERSGETDRAGGRFRMCNIDAMGYSAKSSDPLYKHIPFYITWKPRLRMAFGLFYDTLSDCTFDMGRELDNYHGLYRYFVADHGDLDYYVFAGPSVAGITRRFTWLTGRPAFMPRWSLGYSGSTMSYTDAPDAQKRMGEFLERCAEHRILCQSFHLSSGYTSMGGKRYVFHWNRDKFPDPAAFARSYRDAGVHLAANIKPCLLRGHPLFDEAQQQGLLLAAEDGEPGWLQFWDGVDACLDFTNPRTLAWWKDKVKSALLDYGISATWNDNNEFEVWSPGVLANCFGRPRPAREIRALQPLLMMRASREAQREHSPGVRPFLVTRSGMAGMQRYAQTWSGDNFTSWETLKYNIKMGLGLALSGVSNSGHDVGGFAGPRPDPELFVRWVQAGIFMPRFSIHSWNDDGTANEPWMYLEVTGHVRELVELRNWLAPYLYLLLWRYRSGYEPVIRPTFYDFPNDDGCYRENDDMMLGPFLLVASVVEPGAKLRSVYLPHGADWYDFWSGRTFAGGQTVELPAPWNRPVLLACAGSVIPVNANKPAIAAGEQRAFLLFPPSRGQSFGESYEDDGESEAYRENGYGSWRVTMTGETDVLRVDIARLGRFAAGVDELKLLLPETELRQVELSGARLVDEHCIDGRRCLGVRPSPEPPSGGVAESRGNATGAE